MGLFPGLRTVLGYIPISGILVWVCAAPVREHEAFGVVGDGGRQAMSWGYAEMQRPSSSPNMSLCGHSIPEMSSGQIDGGFHFIEIHHRGTQQPSAC